MILVVGGVKGGSGKSTLATNLAVMRAQKKKKILLIDADKQESTLYWSKQRKTHNNKDFVSFETIQMLGESSYKKIKELSNQYDDIIIDTGGRDTESQRSMLVLADTYLIPFRPRSFDLWTMDDVKAIYKEMMKFNPALKIRSVINQADSRGIENQESQEFLRELNCLKSTLGHRKAFSLASENGLSVIELQNKDNKANTEMKNFYEEIYGKAKTNRV